MKIALSLAIGVAAMLHGPSCLAAGAADEPLTRFWMENDGKTVRRLPVDVLPENVFWSFTTRDFPDGMKAFNRLVDEGFARSTYNCVTLTLRCNPELGDPETQAAAKAFFAKARAAGVKVYMDTDPRIARQEFFSKWPDERQSIATVFTCASTNGAATARHEFKDVQDHMSWGSKNAYRPVSGRIGSALAVKRGADGALDFAQVRAVEFKPEVSVREWRETGRAGNGYVDRSAVTVAATATDLAADETLVVTALAEYFSIDVFSPHLIPFIRSLMVRYRDLGADGGMRDEWGFIPNYDPNRRTFWWSPNFEAAYHAACGRDLLDDFPIMACGPKGDARRAAAREFVMYLTSPETQVSFAMGTGYVPSNALAAESAEWQAFVQEHPLYDVALQQILATPASMRSVTVGPSADFYYTIMNDISDMLENGQTPEETADIMEEDLGGLLWQYVRANP